MAKSLVLIGKVMTLLLHLEDTNYGSFHEAAALSLTSKNQLTSVPNIKD